MADAKQALQFSAELDHPLETGGSHDVSRDVSFPTVESLDAMLGRLDECDALIAQEKARIVEDAKKCADDAAYWGPLYAALHEMEDAAGDEAVAPVDGDDAGGDDDDIGIDKILQRRREKNLVYYQVRWREHRTVTWERADDISAATTLLTAFDKYLRTTASHKDLTCTNPNERMVSRRERRERRLAKELSEETGVPLPAETYGTPAARASSPPATAAGVPTAVPTATAAKPYSVEAMHRVIKRVDALYSNSDKNCCNLSHTVPETSAADRDAMLNVFADILEHFTQDKYQSMYGGRSNEADLARTLKPGDSVPSYFANVGGESIYYRKMLSIAGLRNLIIHGRQIFTEMRSKLFIGDPSAYSSNTGPARMRTCTGNVVDLDSVVLRASDRVTLNAINAWNTHKGVPTFSSTSSFGDSTQAREIAVTAAGTLLEKFIKDFKMTKAEISNRKVDPTGLATAASLPVAHSNNDRGRWPCWRYTNVGVDSFHANVPNLEDVNGALLRAPYHCIKGWLYAKAAGNVDSFFEDCVIDSCFNMKWKAIEEFCEQHERRGTVSEVLEKLQVQHQQELGRIFDEDDSEEAEIDAMVRFLPPGTEGRFASGAVRAITRADVSRWVLNPGQPV